MKKIFVRYGKFYVEMTISREKAIELSEQLRILRDMDIFNRITIDMRKGDVYDIQNTFRKAEED